MKINELRLEHRGSGIKISGPYDDWEIHGILHGMRVETESINIREIGSGRDDDVVGHVNIYLDVGPWSSGPLDPSTECELL